MRWLLVLLCACREVPAERAKDPPRITFFYEKPPPPPPEPLRPAVVEKLPVAGDLDASIVRGTSGFPTTMFVPGLCSNANAYLYGFPQAARAQGGVVAIDGDQPCIEGFRSFSWNAPKLHARIEAAMRAAGGYPERITLIGYSQGASLAEELVRQWPDRYRRVILIGAPVDPAPEKVKTAERVVTMSCEKDVTWRMKKGAKEIQRIGVPAIYLEMPGCPHGYIEDGDRVFGEAFAFLAKK